MHPYPSHDPGLPAGALSGRGVTCVLGLAVVGPPKIGVVVTLKASALNCSFQPSLILKSFDMASARCGAPGLRTILILGGWGIGGEGFRRCVLGKEGGA